MATSQVPSTMKIYSSNLPDLFLFRHSEYNKHVRNLEIYESDTKMVDRLLVSFNDSFHIPAQQEQFSKEWMSAQKQYFEQHKEMLSRTFIQALRGNNRLY